MFEILDDKTNQVVGVYETRTEARSIADQKDKESGPCRYFVRPQRTEAEIEEARKRDEIYLANIRKKYEEENKVDMNEYWKLFNADKQRFLDMGCSEKIAHAQACGLAQYREDRAKGLSTD